MGAIWTPELIDRAERAETLYQLANVGIDVLARHSWMPILEVVCGPISTGGFDDIRKNLRAFELAVSALSETERNVFDLYPFQVHIKRILKGAHDPKRGIYPMAVLEIFCRRLYEAGFIRCATFLPGSDRSTGCRWEWNYFDKANCPILTYPQKLWETEVLTKL